jgi:hypothetical protein
VKPSTKKQIKSGLRLGGGMGASLIAAMLIGISVDGLQSAAPRHLQLWPDAAVAGGLFALATVILMLTSRVWVIYLAGCLLFAIPKCVIVIMSGRDFYSPHGPFSRLEAAELLLFFVVSLFLMYRMLASHIPTILDRLAITLYLVSFVFGLNGHFSRDLPWQVVGLAGLSVAWWLSYKKHRRHHASTLGARSS